MHREPFEGVKGLAISVSLGLCGWAHASEMTLREVVPLLETPTSLRLMEFADPTLFVDKTIRFVNQSEWRMEVVGGRGEAVVESQATVTAQCNGLGEVMHIVVTAPDGRSQSLGLPRRCGSEIVLLEAKPLGARSGTFRQEGDR